LRYDINSGTNVWTAFTAADPHEFTISESQLSIGANTLRVQRVREQVNGITCTYSVPNPTITITNNALPTVEFQITADTICNGDDASIEIDLTGQGVGNWSIEYRINGGGSLFEAAAASPHTLTIPNGSLIVGDNLIELLDITQNNGALCSGTVNPALDEIEIRQNVVPTAAITTADYDICETDDVTCEIDLTGEPTGRYVIEYRIDGGAIQSTGSFNNNPYTLNVGTLVGRVAPYIITLESITQQVGTAAACIGTLGDATINVTVDQLPTVSAAGGNQQYCDPIVDATMTANLDVIGTGTWFLVSKPAATPDPTIDNINLNTTDIDIVAGDWGEYEFEWVITNGTCPESRDTVLIDFGTAPPPADASVATADSVSICYPDYTMDGSDPGWGQGEWSKISGPGAVTYDDEFDRNTDISVDAPGTYKLQWEVTSGTCPPSTDIATVHFKTLPTVTQQADLSECPTDNVVVNAFTSTPVGATYTWTNDETDIGLAANGIGNIATFPANTNETGSDITGTIEVEPTLDGCVGTTMNFDITVKPTSLLNSEPDIIVCPGETISVGNFSCNTGGGETKIYEHCIS